MKVLEVNINCGRGSTGRIVENLALELTAHGHECRAAYSSLPLPDRCRGYAFRIGSDADIRAHGLLTRLFDAHGRGSAHATKRLIRQIREFAPDVIHLHNIHGYYLNYPLLFRFLRTCPAQVVWTLHDAWPMTGHCAHFDTVNCEKWKTGCFDCPERSEYPKSWFRDGSKTNYRRKKESFTGLRNLTLVTPSAWLAGIVRESYLGDYPTRVIYNGIDRATFRPTAGDGVRARYGLPEGGRLLLGVASVWSRRKGLEDFVKLRDLLPAEDAILLVGLTPEQIAKLPAGIVGIARTESTGELAEIYSAADVFLNLTYEDTFPTTNLEALACGTPVLTYRTGGSPEAIDDSCGITVEKGDVGAVPEAIRQLLERKISPEACTARAERFDRSVMAEAYRTLFETLCEKGVTENP